MPHTWYKAYYQCGRSADSREEVLQRIIEHLTNVLQPDMCSTEEQLRTEMQKLRLMLVMYDQEMRQCYIAMKEHEESFRKQLRKMKPKNQASDQNHRFSQRKHLAFTELDKKTKPGVEEETGWSKSREKSSHATTRTLTAVKLHHHPTKVKENQQNLEKLSPDTSGQAINSAEKKDLTQHHEWSKKALQLQLLPNRTLEPRVEGDKRTLEKNFASKEEMGCQESDTREDQSPEWVISQNRISKLQNQIVSFLEDAVGKNNKNAVSQPLSFQLTDIMEPAEVLLQKKKRPKWLRRALNFFR